MSELAAGGGPRGWRSASRRFLHSRYEVGRRLAAISFGLGERFGAGPGCVLRTASVSISRSSAFLFSGSRRGGVPSGHIVASFCLAD